LGEATSGSDGGVAGRPVEKRTQGIRGHDAADHRCEIDEQKYADAHVVIGRMKRLSDPCGEC
jgi:hypothetical protein